MDVFKRNRNLIITIIVLVLFNLVTVTLLIIGKPPHPMGEENMGEIKDNNRRLEHLLKVELSFTNEQAKEYIKLRKEHRDGAISINAELKRLRTQMFDEVLSTNLSPTLSDSLLNLTLEKQAEIEKLTFNHFLDLKNLCDPEQRKKLKLLMFQIEGPPPGRNLKGLPLDGNHDRPPPPPNGERPPN
ncbi:MAG: periplasmic heavy metal sensor [Melioribacteraceae bacterium]|nr:periplasmic heavy metal sensor [Melioribacteraceae bacterium]